MSPLEIRKPHPDPHAGGWVAATPADAQRLVETLGNQLPVAVYSGNRVIGRMTGARQLGSKISAKIEMSDAAWLQELSLAALEKKEGELHESDNSNSCGDPLRCHCRAGQRG